MKILQAPPVTLRPMHFLRTCYALRSTPSDRWLSTMRATMLVLPVQIVPYTMSLLIPLITLGNMKSRNNYAQTGNPRQAIFVFT